MSQQVTAGQVVAAIESGVVVAPTLHEVQTVNQLAARPIKLYDPATGEVKPQRADTADLLRGLMAREKIRTDERQVVDRQKAEAAWAAVHERRAKGLPDLCHECGAVLGMSSASLWRRSTKPWPVFVCKSCASRKNIAAAQASLTPEQRSERTRKLIAALTPERRSKLIRKALAALTPEQRAERARKGNAALTPEQRAERARKGNAALTPEQRAERGRKAKASMTQEQRSEATRKGHATRRAKGAA